MTRLGDTVSAVEKAFIITPISNKVIYIKRMYLDEFPLSFDYVKSL